MEIQMLFIESLVFAFEWKLKLRYNFIKVFLLFIAMRYLWPCWNGIAEVQCTNNLSHHCLCYPGKQMNIALMTKSDCTVVNMFTNDIGVTLVFGLCLLYTHTHTLAPPSPPSCPRCIDKKNPFWWCQLGWKVHISSNERNDNVMHSGNTSDKINLHTLAIVLDDAQHMHVHTLLPSGPIGFSLYLIKDCFCSDKSSVNISKKNSLYSCKIPRKGAQPGHSRLMATSQSTLVSQ